MGEALEIAKVLVSPTMKLMDMVGSAIGTAYKPRHKRKMADASVYEINAVAEAMRNAADMPIVYNKDGVAINSEDFSRLMQRAGTRLALQETIKQHNIESIVDVAYETLERQTTVSNEPVDDDWICSFFDYVANVSSEQMQIIWGKLLAGEITQPGSFSIRTLDVLRKLNQKEALLFKKYAPYILHCWGDETKTFKDYFLFNAMAEGYDEIYFPDIFTLYEAGLFSMSGIAISLFINSLACETIDGLTYKIVIQNAGEEKIRISEPVFLLTEAGKELYDVMIRIGVAPTSLDYYQKCVEAVAGEDWVNENDWQKHVNIQILKNDVDSEVLS